MTMEKMMRGRIFSKAGSQEVFLDFLNEPKIQSEEKHRISAGSLDLLVSGLYFVGYDISYSAQAGKIRKTGNGPYEPNFSSNAGYLE